MKNVSELNLKALSDEDLKLTSGGSEFSESLVYAIGWVAGAAVSMWESFLRHQIQMEKHGLHPIH